MIGSTLEVCLPDGWELWLDGGHNTAAGAALAEEITKWDNTPVVVVCAMQRNKDICGFLKPLANHITQLIAIDLPGGNLGHPGEKIAAVAASMGVKSASANSLDDALRAIIGPPGNALVCGSLYLVGHALAADQSNC
jgi:dihydrofolate synthase/folylpolyglutamate synthase